MFECYGWVSVNEENETVTSNIISTIENTFDEHIALNTHTLGTYMNGTYKASIVINTNHATAWNWVQNLYRNIAKKSSHSYGLVMFFDDEDMNGFDNEFQTWVLKRGVFSREKDLHLSPYIPTVEGSVVDSNN